MPGASYRDLNNTIALKTPQAMRNFQQTFPDVHGFRVRLINQALRYETFRLDGVSIDTEVSAKDFCSLKIAFRDCDRKTIFGPVFDHIA